MSSIPLLTGATHVLKIKPDSALIPATILSTDSLFSLVNLSDSKFSSWKNIASTAVKVGVIDTASGTDVLRFIDTNYNISTHEGSLWLLGPVEQDHAYYIQTGDTLSKENSDSVFNSTVVSYGFHEASVGSVDRCGNKFASGTLVEYNVTGQIGTAFKMLVNSLITIPDTVEIENKAKLTISLVMRQDQVNSSNYEIIAFQGSAFSIQTLSGVMIITINGLVFYADVAYSTYVTDNTWFLLTVVFDGTQTDTDLNLQNSKRFKIFINDTEVPINSFYIGHDPAYVPAITPFSGYDFVLGFEGYGLVGAIDELRIVTDAWTPEEISLRYNQWFNQATYWTTTVQPVISSVTTLGGKRWRIDGSGFKPESTDPIGSVSGVPFTVEAGATDSSCTITDNSDALPGVQLIRITHSDNETDYTLIVSNTKRLVIEGESPTNFIGMPSSIMCISGEQHRDTNLGDPRGNIVDNQAEENIVDGTSDGNPVRTVRGGGSSNLGMYSKPSWLCH